jgi:hypothetical protein
MIKLNDVMILDQFNPGIIQVPFSLPSTCTLIKAKTGIGLAEIEGILSTSNEDSSGEEVLLKGMDISYLNSGYAQLNWWHLGKQNPAMVVGLIDKAEKINNDTELYYKGHLFSKVEAAKAVKNLMESLEEEGKHLGASVEGAIYKKENNKIFKSAAFGGALATQQINKDCFARLIKAVEGYNQQSDSDLDDLCKAISVSGNAPHDLNPVILSHIEGEDNPKGTIFFKLEEAIKLIKSRHPSISDSLVRNFLYKYATILD